MKRLYLLILRSYLGPLILTFFIALFILVMQFLWKYIDDLVGKGLPWYVVGQLLFYASTTFVPLALPLAILLSSLMTFGNLGERYELVAVKSAGISLSTFMRPLVVLSILISVFAFFFSNNVLPVTNLKFKSILYDVRQQKLALNIREGIFYNGIDGYVMRINKKEEDGITIRDVMIYDHSSRMGNTTVTKAESGTMIQSPDGNFLELTLYNGYNYDEKTDRRNDLKRPFQRTWFAEQYRKFDLSQFKMMRTNEELFRNHYQMLNLRQLTKSEDSLKNEINSRRDGLLRSTELSYYFNTQIDSGRIQIPEKETKVNNRIPAMQGMNKEELQQAHESALNAAKNARNNVEFSKNDLKERTVLVHKHEVEWHRKFTLSIACLVLFFIGAPLGAIIRKGGLGLPLVISIVFFVIYHVISMTGEKSVKAGQMDPVIGMWLSSAVLLPLGVILTLKATTDSPLFDPDIWKRFFTGKWLQKKPE
ncbi:MAG: LptF/LptG family permease [Lentimicrobiaceae bacterium]|nr:LptF/LptG family permease [Lentimicrobiaceae bacterium]